MSKFMPLLFSSEFKGMRVLNGTKIGQKKKKIKKKKTRRIIH